MKATIFGGKGKIEFGERPDPKIQEPTDAIVRVVRAKERKMTESNELSENLIFPKGEKVVSENFIGGVWLEMLVDNDDTFNCPIYNVTFEPGARNSWHTHPGGQILLVTSGRGYYQEKGKPARVIQTGNVIKIYPDVDHWHGAAVDSQLSHIGITTNPQKGDAVWLEPVSEEEYKSL
jgi:quercetin dioxygenase-like cupin family protein